MQNAFASFCFPGIWWAASTLLIIGYGDIYPVTMMGKTLGIIISFLGVGMVAIPTGNMMLEAGDRVFLYTKLHLPDAGTIEI